jgi:phosphoribosyl 1,2-cyclic phosphodiesterase
MRTWVLGSGSRGNAVLLEADGVRVLIDAGFAPRELARRLAAIDVDPASIEAVLLTHEHTDHARAAAAGRLAFGWCVYASPRTVAADAGLQEAGAVAVVVGATVSLSTMDLVTVPVPHDAAEPIAVVATAQRTGARTGVAYDLGHATPGVRQALAGLDLLVLEANHDLTMLREGPYPPTVAKRIAGRHGHLDNGAAAALARAVAHRALGGVVLAHLSARCNEPRLAMRAVTDALAGVRRGDVPVSVASQDAIAGPFAPRRRSTTAGPSMQLSLGI